jgi:hypothetical protein
MPNGKPDARESGLPAHGATDRAEAQHRMLSPLATTVNSGRGAIGSNFLS